MDNFFNDMPVAPTPPNFPDLQGENRGRTPVVTPHAGWFQNYFMPWIQSLDLKKNLCLFILAGKLARILSN
jgi:hypothetical protein